MRQGTFLKDLDSSKYNKEQKDTMSIVIDSMKTQFEQALVLTKPRRLSFTNKRKKKEEDELERNDKKLKHQQQEKSLKKNQKDKKAESPKLSPQSQKVRGAKSQKK